MRTIAGALAVVAMATALFGQIPVDTGIVLVEASQRVGTVYRGPGPEDAPVYTEHWILYPAYVYPSPKTLTTLTLKTQAATEFKDEQDFFRRAEFPAGSRYVRVTAEEFDALPAVQK